MKRFAIVTVVFAFLWTAALAISSVRAHTTNRPSSTTWQSADDVLPQGGVVIITPVLQYSWRVWPGGKIEYSFDSSRTWETQKSGVTTDLTGGSAPSAKVCWVVGKSGTILVTTDRGKHWKKVSSPITGDIGGIFAQDGKRASVWTPSHNQSFETSDSGATWTKNESN